MMKKIDIPTYTVEEVLTAIQPHYVPILRKGYPVYMISQAVILTLPQLLASQRINSKRIDEVNKIETIQDIFTEIYRILDKANINSISLATNNLSITIEVATTLFLDPAITVVVENDKQESAGLRFTINGINYIPIINIDLTKAKQILKATRERLNERS